MIAAIRAAIVNTQSYGSHLKTAFFHSTPILQRKHQSNSKARNKRFGRNKANQDLLRNVNAFAQHLFGIWSDGFDYSGKHTSWFEKQYFRVCKRNRNGRQRLDKKKCFDFNEVDQGSEIDYILRTALGGFQSFSWSGKTRSRKYSNNFTRSWGSRYRLDEEEEEEEEEEDYEKEYSSRELNDSESSKQASHRLALGLSISGPLHLEDVKIAYRACALKWHPDRHQASTKNAAEEKFKLCTVAYQSLCEKLVMN